MHLFGFHFLVSCTFFYKRANAGYDPTPRSIKSPKFLFIESCSCSVQVCKYELFERSVEMIRPKLKMETAPTTIKLNLHKYCSTLSCSWSAATLQDKTTKDHQYKKCIFYANDLQKCLFFFVKNVCLKRWVLDIAATNSWISIFSRNFLFH